MGVSLMVEHERLDLPDVAIHDDQTTTIRWSYFVTLRLVPNENLVITSTTYLQPKFDTLGDLRTLENLRVAVSVTDELDLTISFDLRYDSRPPDLISDLVLCSQSLFRFADLGDDGLCRGGPDKGCGVIVSGIDVVVDRLD